MYTSKNTLQKLVLELRTLTEDDRKEVLKWFCKTCSEPLYHTDKEDICYCHPSYDE